MTEKAKTYSFIFISITLIFSGKVCSQNSEAPTDDIIILEGNVGTAIDASFKPDSQCASIYMIVDKDFKYTADELIPGLKTYFDHYDIPVIFVKKTPADKGEGCSFRIYVDGKSMNGSLSNGNFTMLSIKYGHEKAFPLIKEAYDEANR